MLQPTLQMYPMACSVLTEDYLTFGGSVKGGLWTTKPQIGLISCKIILSIDRKQETSASHQNVSLKHILLAQA